MLNRLMGICLTLFILLPGFLISQTGGEISGFVTNTESGEPLLCANVLINGTTLGAATDTKGHFVIKKAPAGTYNVTVSILGYKTMTIENVQVSAGRTAEVNFNLFEQPIELDRVTVTALRGNNLVTDVPVSTDIITSAELEQQPAQNVGEALESVAGVYIKDYGDLSAMKTISIRGSTDSQVLVLIDGQRLNNSQNASVDFSNLPIDAVEKIEIVKGGHSALYGANAVGGVVNIITKSPVQGKPFSAGLNTTFGTAGTQIYSINGSQAIGKFSYFLSVKNMQSDGNYEYKTSTGETQKRENNDLKSDNAFIKLRYNPSRDSDLNISVQYNKSKKGVPGTLTYPWPTRRMDETANFNNISYNTNIFTRLKLTANAYYHKTDSKYYEPAGQVTHSRHQNMAYGFEFQNRFILSKNIILTYGYDFRNDKIKSTELNDQTRNTHSLYLQGELEKRFNGLPIFNKISFIPAVRYDDYSDFGGQASPKAGISISRTGANLASLRANVGKSFRSPTFNDLYWPADYWSVGNPNLKPETGMNYDAGTMLLYNFMGVNSEFEMTYFLNNLEDLIIWSQRSDQVWTPMNVDKSQSKGLETRLSLGFLKDLLNLNIAHTYMDAKNTSENSPNNGKYLIYRPKHKLDLGIGINYEFFKLNLLYRYVDKSFIHDDNSASLPAYRIFDFTVSALPKVFGLKALAKLDVMNVLNKYYTVVNDYPNPGRQIRFTVGLRY